MARRLAEACDDPSGDAADVFVLRRPLWRWWRIAAAPVAAIRTSGSWSLAPPPRRPPSAPARRRTGNWRRRAPVIAVFAVLWGFLAFAGGSDDEGIPIEDAEDTTTTEAEAGPRGRGSDHHLPAGADHDHHAGDPRCPAAGRADRAGTVLVGVSGQVVDLDTGGLTRVRARPSARPSAGSSSTTVATSRRGRRPTTDRTGRRCCRQRRERSSTRCGWWGTGHGVGRQAIGRLDGDAAGPGGGPRRPRRPGRGSLRASRRRSGLSAQPTTVSSSMVLVVSTFSMPPATSSGSPPAT